MLRGAALGWGIVLLVGPAGAQESRELPPESSPGSCYARVLIPESVETITEQVIDQPEKIEIRIRPAQYETVSETVLVKPSITAYEVTPAVFETVVEQVLEVPERTETRVIPAAHETYTERVLVRPAYVTWKPGTGLYGRTASEAPQLVSGAPTGEVLCRVEVPARYEAVVRTRVKSPQRMETVVVPAVYKDVERQVLMTPASVREVTVPAVYETINVQKMTTPAREEIIVVPETYKTIEKKRVVGGGGMEWQEVLCDTNGSPEIIANVQRALTGAGYPVTVDGDFGPATLGAMEAFQTDNGLPVGYLTVSTLDALGVNAN